MDGTPSTDKDQIFLFDLFVSEFQALQALVQATLQRKPSDTLNNALTSTHPNEDSPLHTNQSNSNPVIIRVYRSDSATFYNDVSTWNRHLT